VVLGPFVSASSTRLDPCLTCYRCFPCGAEELAVAVRSLYLPATVWLTPDLHR